MDVIKADFVVVGGGSGGVGAALTAARACQEKKVVLVEKNSVLGGTSTICGVNSWEPGIGGMAGLHKEIASKLLSIPKSAFTIRGSHKPTPEEPWGSYDSIRLCQYEDSLQRSGNPKGGAARFRFEPMAMSRVMRDMLLEAGVTIMTETLLTGVSHSKDRITSVICSTPQDTIKIEADHFADCTADIVLCRMAGCRTAIGEDPQSMFNEDGAPVEASNQLNGATLTFRLTPCEKGYRDKASGWIYKTEAVDWINSEYKAVSYPSFYPCGDIVINMLPTLEGADYWWGSHAELMKKATARVLIYWEYLQNKYPYYDAYRLQYIFPQMGVRESYRLRGRYILTGNDLLASFLHQPKRDEIVAFGDHPIDVHGKGHKRINELTLPYGVPYSSMLPKEYDNLIVACRGGSFSHIAGAACRLSRMMLAMGEAAGTASAMLNRGEGYSQIELSELRTRLKIRQTEDMIAGRWEI